MLINIRYRIFSKNSSMKKTSERFMDFQNKPGFYLKEISLNDSLNKLPANRYDSPNKLK